MTSGAVKHFGTRTFRTIGEFFQWGESELKMLESVESRADIERILEYVTGQNRSWLYLNRDKPLSGEEQRKAESLIALRSERMPLAYLLSEWHFWNEALFVNQSCLIPRQETETVIETVVGESGIHREADFLFWDCGCGSGSIGIALLREYPNSFGVFSDISEEALEVTRKNLLRYELTARAETLQGDLFEAMHRRVKRTAEPIQLLVSNPPYIPSGEVSGLQPEVLWEPRVALDGGLDGLFFYRRFAAESHRVLAPEAFIALELGAQQAEAATAIFKESGFYTDIQTHNDLLKIERVISARVHG